MYFTDGMAPAMVRGTDIGPMIPHVGPPSITIAIEMLTSGSKSYFGSSQYQVNDQHKAPGNLACAALGFTNPNLNCGMPAPTPFGMVIAPTTHIVSMTIGDVIAGLVMMGFDYMLQRVMYVIGSKAGEFLKKNATVIGERLGITALGRTAARQAARALGVRSNIGPAANLLRAQSAQRLAKLAERLTIYGFTPVGFFLGSPLGVSISNVRDGDGNQVFSSGSDRVSGWADPEGAGDALGKETDGAIRDYFNSPSIEDAGDGGPGGAQNVSDGGASSGQSGVSAEGGATTDGGDQGEGGASGAPDAGLSPVQSAIPETGESAGEGNMSAAVDSASTPDEPNACLPDGSDSGDPGGAGSKGNEQ